MSLPPFLLLFRYFMSISRLVYVYQVSKHFSFGIIFYLFWQMPIDMYKLFFKACKCSDWVRSLSSLFLLSPPDKTLHQGATCSNLALLSSHCACGREVTFFYWQASCWSSPLGDDDHVLIWVELDLKVLQRSVNYTGCPQVLVLRADLFRTPNCQGFSIRLIGLISIYASFASC